MTLTVLAFWASVGGWIFGFGQMPALGLLLIGAFMLLARKTALVCESCGFVKPRRLK